MVKSIRKFINYFSMQSKATVAYLICNLLLKCINFITFPIFARLMSLEHYGLMTIYGTLLTFFSIFLTLNLQYATFQTAMLKYEDDKDGYISSANGLLFIISVIFLLLYTPFKNEISAYLNIPSYLIYILVLDVYFGNVISLYMARERFFYKYKEVVYMTLILCIVSVTLGIVLVLNFENKGIARIVSTASINVIVGIFLLIMQLQKSNKFINIDYFKYIIIMNVPLLPYYLSQLVFDSSDRLMIDKLIGREEVALYDMGGKIGTIMIIMLNSINAAFIPWLFKSIKNKNYDMIKKVTNGIATIYGIAILTIILIFPEFIKILLGEKYMASINVVPPISLSLLLQFYTQNFINVDFYYEQKKYIVLSGVVAATSNVILNLIFIPKYGFVAAGYTTLVSYLVYALITYYTMRLSLRKNNIKDSVYDINYYIKFGIAFMIIGLLFSGLYPYFTGRIVLLSIILIICFINREVIIKKINEYLYIIKAK